MLGIWPWQKEFALLSEGAGNLEPFYCEELEKIVYARDRVIFPGIFQGQLRGGGPLRAIAVSMSSPAAVEAIILTNLAQGEGTAKDAAGIFLRRWPYLDKGPAGRALARVSGGGGFVSNHQTPSASSRDALARMALESGSPQSQGEQTDLFVLSRDLGGVLDRYCKNRFFDGLSISDTTCYKMPGCCLNGEGWLAIFLKPSAGYERLEELRLAVQRFNESAVTDPWNRQLFIIIE